LADLNQMLNVQTNFSTYPTIKFSALLGLLHADANSETDRILHHWCRCTREVTVLLWLSLFITGHGNMLRSSSIKWISQYQNVTSPTGCIGGYATAESCIVYTTQVLV